MVTHDDVRSLYAALVRVLGRREATTLLELPSPPGWHEIVGSYTGVVGDAPAAGSGGQT